MGNRYLLDCTLRDGGYVNDWEFGQDNLIKVFERLALTGIDIIEVGFLDERRPYDINRSILPDTASVQTTWGMVVNRPPMVVGMIDYGTCGIEHIQPCSESFLDGIRVIFKKQKMYEAMEFCRQVKNLGYKVFSQLVSITAYSDDELRELISLVNEVKPYAVSMVDTYGLLNPKWLLHYYQILDDEVDQNIQIGYHAHNNFQLAYANAIAFLAKDTERDILVDGTLFGMGKSAGNAPLELLAMHMNEVYGKCYDTRPMLESIEENIKPFYIKSPWGYKTFFYLCASNKCHPSYVEYFQNKGNLSVSKLDSLLGMIQPEEKKLLYDKELAESLYQKYVYENMHDEEVFIRMGQLWADRTVLLIGPGKNIKLQGKIVEDYIDKKNPIVIALNYIPHDLKIDYVFVTKAGRYKDMTVALHEHPEIGVIATTNLEPDAKEFAFVVSREPLLEQKETITDNPFLMILNILKKSRIKNIACAGLDGYSDKEDNYANPGMEYEFVKREAQHLNRHIREVLASEYADMALEFLTYSHYNEIRDIESGGF